MIDPEELDRLDAKRYRKVRRDCDGLWKHYAPQDGATLNDLDAAIDALNANPTQEKKAGTVLSSSGRNAPSSGSLPDTPGPASGLAKNKLDQG